MTRPRLLLVLQNPDIPFLFRAAAREQVDVDLVHLPGRAPAQALPGMVTSRELDIFGRRAEALAVLLAEHSRNPYAGVLTATEAAVTFTAELAHRLDLPGLDPAAARECRSKSRQRERMAVAGLSVPAFADVSDATGLDVALDRMAFPVVVKPINGLSSQGVMRADSVAEARHAFRLARAVNEETLAAYTAGTGEAHGVVVEEYLDGLEYCVESMVDGGEVTVLAVAFKGDLRGPVFEEGTYITPADLTEAQVRLMEEEVVRAHRALGVDWGATHTELRLCGERPVVLELNARMGGSAVVHHMVHASTGFDFAGAVVRQSLGRPPGRRDRRPAGAVGANWIVPTDGSGTYEGLDGLEDVEAHADTVDVLTFLEPGQVVPAQPRFAGYPAFVLSRHGSYQACVEYQGWLADRLRTRWSSPPGS